MMTENFSNMAKETDIQVRKAQKVSNKMNPNRPTQRHIILKMSKVKERILKAAREKHLVTYKGTPIRPSANFQQKLYRPEETGTIY